MCVAVAAFVVTLLFCVCFGGGGPVGCETMLRPLCRRGDVLGLRRHLDRFGPRLARLAAQAARGAEEWWRVTRGAEEQDCSRAPVLRRAHWCRITRCRDG